MVVLGSSYSTSLYSDSHFGDLNLFPGFPLNHLLPQIQAVILKLLRMLLKVLSWAERVEAGEAYKYPLRVLGIGEAPCTLILVY